MLTISKPLSAGQRRRTTRWSSRERTELLVSARSHSRGVARPPRRQIRPWRNGLCRRLRETQPGPHPQTGEQLVRQRASYEYQDADGKRIKTMEHRAGWDATFSAPKSVSLTALVGGDERVREAPPRERSRCLDSWNTIRKPASAAIIRPRRLGNLSPPSLSTIQPALSMAMSRHSFIHTLLSST